MRDADANPDAGRRLRMSHGGWAAGVTTLMLAWLASTVGEVQAAESHCAAMPQDKPAPYQLHCNNKSECLVSDQLVLEPAADHKAPLQAACLRLRSSLGAAEHFGIELPVAGSTEAAPVRQSYALASLLQEHIKNPALIDILRSAASAKAIADVVVKDAAGSAATQPLVLNVTSLWADRSIRLKLADKAHCPGGACRMSDAVSIEVPHLETWASATQGDPSKLQLAINGVRMAQLPATLTDAPAKAANRPAPALSFVLKRDTAKPDNMLAWDSALRHLMGQKPQPNGTLQGLLSLSDDKGSVSDNAAAVDFQVNRSGSASLAGAFLVLLLVAIGKRTQWRWLRDTAPVPDLRDTMPFSLARLQMVAWTVIVAVACVFIGLSVGDWNAVNGTAAALMGISLGTAVGATWAGKLPETLQKAVDAYTEGKAQAATLAVQRDGLAAATPPDTAAITLANAVIANHQNLQISRLASLRLELQSKGPVIDLSSEMDDQTGLHRIQIMVFTVLFIAVFVWHVLDAGSMPTFDNMQLALLGISGTAYAGFKFAAAK